MTTTFPFSKLWKNMEGGEDLYMVANLVESVAVLINATTHCTFLVAINGNHFASNNILKDFHLQAKNLRIKQSKQFKKID